MEDPFFEDWAKVATPEEWTDISQCDHLGDDFFIRYIEAGFPVDFTELSRNQYLTSDFFELYKGRMNWRYLSENPGLGPKFFLKNINMVYPRNLFRNPGLREEFYHLVLKNYFTQEESDNSLDSCNNSLQRIIWHELSSRVDLSYNFFIYYISKIVWKRFMLNPSIGLDFFEKNFEIIPKKKWKNIITYPKINEDFAWRIYKHIPMNYLKYFSYNTAVGENFINELIKCSVKVIWDEISKKNFSEEFFLKYKSNINMKIFFMNKYVSREFKNKLFPGGEYKPEYKRKMRSNCPAITYLQPETFERIHIDKIPSITWVELYGPYEKDVLGTPFEEGFRFI
jgi:hypothetical protein